MEEKTKAAWPLGEYLCRRTAVSLLLGSVGAAFVPVNAWAKQLAPVMLARVYEPGIDLALYAASEKYDGVRGYWDGKQLWTRGNEPVAAPSWFTAGWPAYAMDGELWAGRGKFAQAVSTVRQQRPDETAWRDMKFMVFDLPSHGGPFRERAIALPRAIANLKQPWVVPVEQAPVASHAALLARMRQIVKDGGEGVALHRLDAPYRAGRSGDLLKFKPDADADAQVLAHVPGRGKYEGMMGALLVQTAEGQRFKLGTGFDEAARRNPPPVGSWISYRYRGENDSGIPRFASFLRVRADL